MTRNSQTVLSAGAGRRAAVSLFIQRNKITHAGESRFKTHFGDLHVRRKQQLPCLLKAVIHEVAYRRSVKIAPENIVAAALVHVSVQHNSRSFAAVPAKML